MNIKLAREDEAFRGEIRAFLDGSLTETLRDAARKRTSLWQDLDASMKWQRLARVPTSPRSKPAPFPRATTMSSTVLKFGPATLSTQT